MATAEQTSGSASYCRSVAQVYAGAAPGANTNILTTSLTPDARAAAYRVTVSLATGSVFDVRVTDGTNAYTQHLNAGTPLTASCIYTFTFAVRRTSSEGGSTNLSYNFRVATDGVIQTLFVEEVGGPEL